MNAFDIEVNGQFLDLPDNPLRYELINSLFITDVYQGDWSFPYDVPLTPTNKKIFGFANVIATQNKVTEYKDVWLQIRGIAKKRCTLKITGATHLTLRITLSAGIKTLPNSDKKLKEVLKGKTHFLGNDQNTILANAKKAAEEGDWTVYGFSMVPFYAPNFYNGTNPHFSGVCNRVNSTTGNFLGNGTTSPNSQYTLVPWLFLFYLLNEIFRDAGLTPTGSFWENEEYSKMLLVNNKAVELRPLAFNTVVLEDLKASSRPYSADFTKIIFHLGPPGTYDNPGCWREATTEYEIKTPGTHIFKFEIVYFNDSFNVTFGREIIGGKIEMVIDGSTVYSENVKKGARTIRKVYGFTREEYFSPADVGKLVYYQYMTTGAFPGNNIISVHRARLDVLVYPNIADLPYKPGSTVTYSDHVTDETVGGFLSEIKKLGISYDFDTPGQVILSTTKSLLEDPETIDISENAVPGFDNNMEDRGKGTSISYNFPDEEKIDDKPEYANITIEAFSKDELPTPFKEGDYAIVTNTNEVYQVVKEGSDPLIWRKKCYHYRKHVIGNGENDLKLGYAPIQMCIANNEGGTAEENKALMPYYPYQGSSDLFGLGTNDFTFRLCFWRGYNRPGPLEIPLGGKYVLASTGIFDMNKNVRGKYTFRLDVPENIIRDTSERFLEAQNDGELVEKDLFFTTKQLNRVKATSKVIVDYNLFLVKSLSIAVSKTVINVKAYLLKL